VGGVDMLQWLIDNNEYRPDRIIVPNLSPAHIRALAECFRANSLPHFKANNIVENWFDNDLTEAANHEWIAYLRERQLISFHQLVVSICAAGRLDLLKFVLNTLYDSKRSGDLATFLRTDSTQVALFRGHLPIIKYFVNDLGITISFPDPDYNAHDLEGEGFLDDLDCVKWFVDYFKSNHSFLPWAEYCLRTFYLICSFLH